MSQLARRVYLDANATSSLRPEAEDILSFFIAKNKSLKNPSSVHQPGQQARALLKIAKDNIRNLLLGVQSELKAEIFFTSGGSESCNTLVSGFLDPTMNGKVLVSAIEHPSMLEAIRRYRRFGYKICEIMPNKEGFVSVDTYLNELSSDTSLVSLMGANNETGAVQPVLDLAIALRANGYNGAIISDQTQILGKFNNQLPALFDAGINAVAYSGHKVGAIPGIGVCVINKNSGDACFEFEPFIVGGAQENRYRAGTENILGVMTFGEVSRVLATDYQQKIQRVRQLRNYFWNLLSVNISDIEALSPEINTDDTKNLANTLLVKFGGCRGDDLVISLDLAGVHVSTGSACASGKQEVSHVVTAMGFDKSQAKEVVRFSLDWNTTKEDLEFAASVICQQVALMRKISSQLAI
jgi:cysteine desulfurase